MHALAFSAKIMASKSTIFIFTLLLLITNISGSKLNVPRVLLPIFNDFSTRFLLEATEGGCYKWTTTRTDIIQLNEIGLDPDLLCSTKVIVSTITKEAARNIAVVLAEDVHTKQLLRCDVIVDVIDSLVISTTTRELFMEEAPESFEVTAYDDQGNEFSTLEEIELEWVITSMGPSTDSVLQYMRFKDSPYETPPAIAALEQEDKKGYIVLLEGIKTGSAKVSVKLPYLEYKHVQPNEVQLMVVANLLLTPGEVYLMPGDVANFKIFYINNGRMEEVLLPDSQYYLEAEDFEVASSQKKSGTVIALKTGVTRIVLRDRNVGKDDMITKLPAATIHVVMPAYLSINVMPHRNWAILVGDSHDIQVDIYSSNDHKLIIGPAVQISVEVSPEFYVMSKSTNGSWLTGHGVKSALAVVAAKLEGVYNDNYGQITFDQPITAVGDLYIYPRISITPSEVILPWDPLSRSKYDVDLVAKGGDGKFLWTSSDNSIGIVSQAGHVHTQSNGFFEVSAAMLKNHHNRQSAKFLILPPSRLEIVEFVMEAEIGMPVHLHIALYAEQTTANGQHIQIPFTKCQNLPFQIRQSDIKFRQNRTSVITPVGVSCANVAMIGLDVGTSKVTITYFHDGKALEDSATVSAYKPLSLLEPKRDVVLAVGSSINLVYVGGPRPIIGRSSEHQRVVVSDHADVASAFDITSEHNLPGEDLSVVRVLCRKLGEADIKLMIANTPSASNCKSQSSTITTRVTCGKPRKVVLQPELQIADVAACPMDLSAGNVIVQGSRNIELDVAVYDDCGVRLLNISSLNLQWSNEPPGSATFHNKDGVFPRNLTLGTIDVAHRAFQVVQTANQVGSVLVNVTVLGYKNGVLKRNGITAEWPEFVSEEDGELNLPPIVASLSLYLVDDMIIEPSALTIFNHPGNKKVVDVKQGSGYFQLELSTEDVAIVKYMESSRQIEIIPVRSGELTIQLKDLCLVSKVAMLRVNVVAVGIMRVEMVDKVEVNKCISCIVRLYDENDNLMDIPDPHMVDVRPSFEQKIANIQKTDFTTWQMGAVHFIVTGVELGDTKLVFSSASGDEDVTSAPQDLQVFLPLKLNPRNATILVGTKFQFNIKGGPQPDVVIHYSTDALKVADVDKRGIINGKSLGTTRVVARATGTHPGTGEPVLFSEDTVDVHVIALTGIKIAAPLARFQVGNTVPFWCFGVPDISPMILGSVDPAIAFKWRLDDNILVDMHSMYQSVGVDYKRTNKIAVKLTGLQPGRTRLVLNATVAAETAAKLNVKSITFSTWIEIEVFPGFFLTNPRDLTHMNILMAPFSKLQLLTNLDTIATKIVYTLPNTEESTELLADQSVSPNDNVIQLSRTGQLTSCGLLGHALVVITASDEYGLKQRIYVAIEVKPIFYMNVNILANWRIHASSPVDYIPIGTLFQLKASFHDNLGNTFHAGPTELKVRTSRCDLVKVMDSNEAATVWVYTKKVGHTVLKAWADGVQKTADYVKIYTEQSVKPMLDHLNSGDIICLWTPVVTEYNVPGQWRSSDPTLVAMNPALDIGFVGDREGVVVLTHSLLAASPIHIQVYPVSIVEFLPHQQNHVLTNGAENTLDRFVLVLQSDKSVGIKTNNLIQGWRCRTDVRKLVRPKGFKCFHEFSNHTSTIQASDLFNITTSWVPETGQYACKLINLGVNNTNVAVLRTNLTVWATTEDEQIRSERLTVRFVPGFFVPHEIVTIDNTNMASLDVVGLPEVLQQTTVEPADSSIIYVDAGAYVTKSLKRFKVQLIDYHWRLAEMEDAMGIIIKSKLTRQNIKVMLRASDNLEKQICGAGRSPVFIFMQNYKYALLMTAAMLLVFFLTFYIYTAYMQPVVNVNVNPNRTLLHRSPRASPGNRCAAAIYSNTLNRSGVSPSKSPARCDHRAGCGCGGRMSNREPVYGDPSTFYSGTPDVRRNRRCM